MKTMTFLTNPRGRRSRRARVRKRSIAARKVRTRRTRKRVSVSPGRAVQRRRQRRKLAATSQGGSMARKRRRRRGSRAPVGVARRNPPRSRRRRFRRNPAGLRGIVPFVTTAAVDAAESLAGIITARKVRGMMIGQQPGTIMAALVEAGVGIAGGLVLSRVNANLGARFAQGGLLAPMMTMVQQARIPFVSDSLGDDGFVLGDGLGAYIGDDDISGYVGPGGAERIGDGVGDYANTGTGTWDG